MFKCWCFAASGSSFSQLRGLRRVPSCASLVRDSGRVDDPSTHKCVRYEPRTYACHVAHLQSHVLQHSHPFSFEAFLLLTLHAETRLQPSPVMAAVIACDMSLPPDSCPHSAKELKTHAGETFRNILQQQHRQHPFLRTAAGSHIECSHRDHLFSCCCLLTGYPVARRCDPLP